MYVHAYTLVVYILYPTLYYIIHYILLCHNTIGDKRFTELNDKTQATLIKERIKKYSNRVYKKTKITNIQNRINTVCMRENPFYVNTVRAFRDRRYVSYTHIAYVILYLCIHTIQYSCVNVWTHFCIYYLYCIY